MLTSFSTHCICFAYLSHIIYGFSQLPHTLPCILLPLPPNCVFLALFIAVCLKLVSFMLCIVFLNLHLKIKSIFMLVCLFSHYSSSPPLSLTPHPIYPSTYSLPTFKKAVNHAPSAVQHCLGGRQKRPSTRVSSTLMRPRMSLDCTLLALPHILSTTASLLVALSMVSATQVRDGSTSSMQVMFNSTSITYVREWKHLWSTSERATPGVH